MMQEYTCKIDTTSKRIAVFIQDSSKADGSGLAGLVFNSASLTCYYWRENEGNVGATAVTLATATRGTFTSSGFIEKDATNMPGWYEFGVPNAAIATGAKWVEIAFKGAANMALTPVRIHLVNYDPFDAVRLGLTAMPNAAADAAGGLPISDAGGLDMDAILSRLPAALTANGNMKSSLVEILTTALTETAGQIAAAFKQFFDVASPTGTMKAITNVVTTTNLTNAPTSGDLTATMKASVNTEVDTAITDARLDELLSADSDIDGLTPPTVGSVVHEMLTKTAGSFTYDQVTDSLEAVRDRGDAAWITATGFSTLDAAGVRSAVGLAAANLDTQLTAIDDFLDTEVAAIKAKTDNLPTDPADQSAVEAAITGLLTTQMTESYNADGAAPTVAQALMVIMQRLTEFSISGTTITVKKLDGSTSALTLTMDSATIPTSSTRAT